MALRRTICILIEHLPHNPPDVGPAKTQSVRTGELARQRVADKDARCFARQPLTFREARVFECPRGYIQRQPVRGIRGAISSTGHAKASSVKLITFDKGAFSRVSLIGALPI